MSASLARGSARALRSLPPIRGRGMVGLMWYGRLARPSDQSFSIRMQRGHTIEAPMGSSQSWRAAFTGSYDDEELDVLIPHIEDGSVILDIGASLGFYAIPLALAARARNALLVAVEPVTGNCELLRRNAERNGVADVVAVVRAALGRERGEAVMHVEEGGLGNATIVSGLDSAEVARHDKAGRTSAAEVVEMWSLDDMTWPEAADGRRCSLMKMDVEGFELDVLAGARGFLAANRPIIFAEFHPVWLQTRGVEQSAPQDWATAHQYDCAELVYRRAGRLSDRRIVSLRPLSPEVARSGTGLLLTPR